MVFDLHEIKYQALQDFLMSILSTIENHRYQYRGTFME
jgi:hypothetical protein